MMMSASGDDPLGAVASHLDREDYSGARAELSQLERTQLKRQDQGRALAMEVLCAALIENERVARKHLWDAVEQHRDDPAFLHGTGLELADRGYFAWAEAVLSKACDIDQANADSFLHLGGVLMRDERLEEAVELFDKALARNPRLADAWLERARCAADLGDNEAASESLRRYLALCPEDALEWVSLAIVESDSGEYDAAYQAYQHAEQVEPTSIMLHFNWAITADKCGDTERLRKACEQLDQLAPDDWRTAIVTAFLAENEGDLDATAAALAHARERCDDDLDYRCLIASLAIRFAARYARYAELDAAVAWAFTDELFSDDVLAALREVTGYQAGQASEYQVVIDAVDAAKPTSRFLRSYAVVAESEELAARMAAAFERRCGASDVHVSRVEEVGEVEDHEVGIWWRDEEISVYSVREGR